jgi:hypothetical protein
MGVGPHGETLKGAPTAPISNLAMKVISEAIKLRTASSDRTSLNHGGRERRKGRL